VPQGARLGSSAALAPVKIGRSKAGVLSGPILDPRQVGPHLSTLPNVRFNLTCIPTHFINLLIIHSISLCHKLLYPNIYNTIC